MALDSTDDSPEDATSKDASKAAALPESPGSPGLHARMASARQIRLLGLGLIFLALLLAYLFLVVWPSEFSPQSVGNSPQVVCLFTHTMCVNVTMDIRLIMMVMVAGGLGSFVHTATSFGDFVGNEKLTTNWVWWYILKPFIGMALAVIFYLMIRGSFLSISNDAGNLNIYGIAAMAGMAGMFSKQATDKLSEVFDTLFRTAPRGGDARRKNNLENAVPFLSGIDPMQIESATKDMSLTIKGTGFVNGSVAQINGINRETDFKDSTRLTVKLLPDDVLNEGDLDVVVLNPPPGGGISVPLKLKIALPPP